MHNNEIKFPVILISNGYVKGYKRSLSHLNKCNDDILTQFIEPDALMKLIKEARSFNDLFDNLSTNKYGKFTFIFPYFWTEYLVRL